jgi:hypothetical protein
MGRKRDLIISWRYICEFGDESGDNKTGFYCMDKKALRKKQQIISLFFGELPVKRRTVGDILSNKETYDSEDDQGNDIVVRCMQILFGYHPEIPILGRGMKTRPIWKCPCIKTIYYILPTSRKRHPYWPGPIWASIWK